MRFKILVAASAVAMAFSCSAEKSASYQESAEAISESEQSAARAGKKLSPSAPLAQNFAAKDENPASDKRALTESGLNVITKIEGRKLEFSADMVYETENFAETRRKVLALIPKYGFVRNMQATAHNKGNLYLTMAVRSDKLYDLVKEFDTLGLLVSENIRTIDHTEKYVEKNIKADREKLRMARRSRAEAANRKDAESFLERSEDNYDKTLLDDWRISDKISWAHVSLTISGPKPSAAVKVPDFQKTLVQIASGFLVLLDILLLLTPFLLVVAGLIYVVRKLIFKFRKAG